MRTSVAVVGLIAIAGLVAALTGRSAGDDVRDLGHRIESLEQATRELADRPATVPEAPTPEPELLTTPRPSIEVRLAALERRVERLVKAAGESRASMPRKGPTPSAPKRSEEVRRWIDRLEDRRSDADIRFSSTVELARLGSLEAVPALIRFLEKDKDFYVRLGSAAALGQLGAADAVTVLITSLQDKEELVRTASAEALRRIAGQDFDYVSGLTAERRREIQEKWRTWWRDHEPEVRDRLRAAREKKK